MNTENLKNLLVIQKIIDIYINSGRPDALECIAIAIESIKNGTLREYGL